MQKTDETDYRKYFPHTEKQSPKNSGSAITVII